jgi:hypothetical protein
MMSLHLLVFVVCSLLVPDGHGQCNHLDAKTLKLTSDITVKFYESFENRDLDAVLATIDAPWYHDGKAVLHSKDEVRAEFKALLEKRRDVKGRKVADVKGAHCYHTVRDRINPNERKLLDQVVKDDDYLVLVVLRAENNSKANENVVVLVRVKDGAAKVLGVKN